MYSKVIFLRRRCSFVWLVLMSCPTALHLKCKYNSFARRVNNTHWGCGYKCGSNEVVRRVTTLAALRGSLIYHCNAPPPAFYLSLPWRRLTGELVLEIVRGGGSVGALAGTDGLSNGPFPPPASSPRRDRLEKQGGRRASSKLFRPWTGLLFDPHLWVFSNPISLYTNHSTGFSCKAPTLQCILQVVRSHHS